MGEGVFKDAYPFYDFTYGGQGDLQSVKDQTVKSVLDCPNVTILLIHSGS